MDLDLNGEGALREAELRQWLEREVWPKTTGIAAPTKREIEDLLGYDEMLGT